MDEPLDEAAAEQLVARVCAGDKAAWPTLVERLVPALQLIVRTSRKMGPLRESPDHRMNVVTAVLEKLSRSDYRSLSTYTPWRTANAGKTFGDWLRIVTTNIVRDYVERQLGGRSEKDVDAPSGKKRLMHSLASALPADDAMPPVSAGMTDAQTARAILEHARLRLDPRQLAALELWLRGAEPAEIARELGTGADEGTKIVRAALAKLRREFAAT